MQAAQSRCARGKLRIHPVLKMISVSNFTAIPQVEIFQSRPKLEINRTTNTVIPRAMQLPPRLMI